MTSGMEASDLKHDRIVRSAGLGFLGCGEYVDHFTGSDNSELAQMLLHQFIQLGLEARIVVHVPFQQLV